MEFIKNIKLLLEYGKIFDAMAIFLFLFIVILFFILAVSCGIKKEKDNMLVWASFCIFFIIPILICYININNTANDLKKDVLRKQKMAEEQKRENHINKMCFMLDTGAKSDLKKDDLAKETFDDLSEIANKIYWGLQDIQDDYYTKNKTSNGFSDNKDFSKIYSLGYQNLLKIKEEMDNRRFYCFKNYCSGIYYNKHNDYIKNTLQNYIELQCNKGDKND